MTLTEFLLARIAEDERAARKVQPLGHVVDMGGVRLDERFTHSRLRFSSADGWARTEDDPAAAAHFARHDPARVLRECEAKRQLIERVGNPDWAGFRILAMPYADHPDYRQEWRP